VRAATATKVGPDLRGWGAEEEVEAMLLEQRQHKPLPRSEEVNLW
jgi:hypothetical protein